MNKFPFGDNELRLAILGMTEGNGHPYSWSAIINGYDREAMQKCPFAAIPGYLFREPDKNFGIPGVKVTHIHTQDRGISGEIAAASKIPHVLDRPEDAIGHVDAVVIATDIGSEHVGRCRPFVEAGMPLFIDKPLTDNVEDLRTFRKWVDNGAVILSSSSTRYVKEYAPYRQSTVELGELRYASVTMAKSWEAYGMHALEGLYAIVGPGVKSVRNSGGEKRNIVHIEHSAGIDIVVAVIDDMMGGFGCIQLTGTQNYASVKPGGDTFRSFKAQMSAFAGYLRSGIRPYPFEETVELAKTLIAGIISREQGGRKVELDELKI